MIPDLPTLLWAGALGLLSAVVIGVAAASLRRRGVRVPYTRKVFHLGIFTLAGAVHAVGGLPATNAYGAAVALVVLAAVVRGDGHPLYEALARETDRPHRTLFILVPLLTTAVGGLASALLVGPYAAVGYLVVGWGDAVGEPVGTWWGRHPYRVPSLGGVVARRTWEGTAAVFAVSAGAALVGLLGMSVPPERAAVVALAVAAGSTVTEAVSHHGTDNLTVQLAASLVAAGLSR